MRTWKPTLVTTALALALGACGSRPANLNLGVDLYLHPDSAAPADVMLQAAIQERLNQHEALRRDVIHVRVYQLNVFLSGTVKDPCASGRIAEQIADSTTVQVNSGSEGASPITRKRIENHIQGADNQPCRS
jgi:osmotically-inducible protein OsmY